MLSTMIGPYYPPPSSSSDQSWEKIKDWKSFTEEKCIRTLKKFTHALYSDTIEQKFGEKCRTALKNKAKRLLVGGMSPAAFIFYVTTIFHNLPPSYLFGFLTHAVPLYQKSIEGKVDHKHAKDCAAIITAKLRQCEKDIENFAKDLICANEQANLMLQNSANVSVHSTTDTNSCEIPLQLTFGVNPSRLALDQFLEHYLIVKVNNVSNKIDAWLDPSHRAFKLCFQLRGDAASHVFKELLVLRQGSTCDDEVVMDILREKYQEQLSTEDKIIEFEDLKQREREDLAGFMHRCTSKGGVAYRDFGKEVIEQRVAVGFMRGIRDQYVRSAVVGTSWMLSSTQVKPLQDILHTAELEAKRSQNVLKFVRSNSRFLKCEDSNKRPSKLVDTDGPSEAKKICSDGVDSHYFIDKMIQEINGPSSSTASSSTASSSTAGPHNQSDPKKEETPLPIPNYQPYLDSASQQPAAAIVKQENTGKYVFSVSMTPITTEVLEAGKAGGAASSGIVTSSTPSINTPSINTPSINTPSINTPSINTPSINTPSINPNLTDAQPSSPSSSIFHKASRTSSSGKHKASSNKISTSTNDDGDGSKQTNVAGTPKGSWNDIILIGSDSE